MKIILTGSSGFVGTKLSKFLSNKGNDIYGIDVVKKENKSLKAFFEIDLSKINNNQIYKFTNIQNFDLVIHCAAAKGDYNLSKDDFYRDNVKATEGLVKLLKKIQVKNLIHYSTVSVYGHKNLLKDENANLVPNNPYGETKLQSENILLDWQKENSESNLTILRPSVIYGENNYANMFNLLTFLNKKIVITIGKGDHIKSMIALENLINITFYCINKKGVNIYNCTDAPYYSLNEVFSILDSVDGFNKPQIKIPFSLAYLIAYPFELMSKILNKDFKISRDRMYKFSTATDYRSDKITNEGYVQEYDTKERLINYANWYLKQKK